MTVALTLALGATWLVLGPPEIDGATLSTDSDRARSPVGLEFAESIPNHDRAPLQQSFVETVPLACPKTVPCVEGCDLEAPTVGLALDGQSRNYALRWVASDPRLEAPLIVESRCELCSLVELEQQFAVDLTRVCAQLDALEAEPGRLELSSDPSGARVRIDGELVGRTPWTGELAAGVHTVELSARGHRPTLERVEISGNAITTHQHFSLTPNLAPRGRPTWPAWTSLGLGLALSVAGTALIAVDGQPWQGRCSGDDVDALGNCRFVLRTRPLGIGLSALGVGAVASGVGLMVWAQRDPNQASAGLAVGGRF